MKYECRFAVLVRPNDYINTYVLIILVQFEVKLLTMRIIWHDGVLTNNVIQFTSIWLISQVLRIYFISAYFIALFICDFFYITTTERRAEI